MAKIIGIDLGTTNSVSPSWKADTPKVIPNKEGANTTPSVVAFTKDGKRLVGVLGKTSSSNQPRKHYLFSKTIYWA